MNACDKICDFNKNEYGDNSSQYADSLYVRAKLVYKLQPAKAQHTYLDYIWKSQSNCAFVGWELLPWGDL